MDAKLMGRQYQDRQLILPIIVIDKKMLRLREGDRKKGGDRVNLQDDSLFLRRKDHQRDRQ